MSAYIISERNINKIVNSAAKYEKSIKDSTICGNWVLLQDPQVLEKAGQMLTDENYRSVNYRYSEHDTPPEFHYSPMPFAGLTPVELLKALDCLEYQSCEHPGWKDSQALRFIDQVRAAAIRALPGYKEAKWFN